MNELKKYDIHRSIALLICVAGLVVAIIELFNNDFNAFPLIGPGLILFASLLNTWADAQQNIIDSTFVELRKSIRNRMFKDWFVWTLVFVIYYFIAHYFNGNV